MSEVIESMRTYFASGDRVVDAPTFARGILAVQQGNVRRQMATLGFAPMSATTCLGVTLPDPDAPGAIADDAPLRVYVNHGEWKVRCDQDYDVEFADLERPLFMCASHWNAHVGYRWRPVILPVERVAIERLLLRRPIANRNWRYPETVADLARDNREHGLGDD